MYLRRSLGNDYGTFLCGTNGRDGAALAGALLEEMDRVSITGIFATHLHELFDLPLKVNTLSYKRMGIDWVRGPVVVAL